MPLIKDDHVQAAFDYLNDSADAAAMAKCKKILAEGEVKRIEAELMREAEGPIRDKENYARSHPRWKAAKEAEAKAAGDDEWHRHQKIRASAVIDAWRTEQSNLRGASRVA